MEETPLVTASRIMELVPGPALQVGDRTRWTCTVIRRHGTVTESAQELWFQGVPGEGAALAPDDCEPWLLAMCMQAMKEGRDLEVRGRVSRLLLGHLEEFMAMWVNFRPAIYHPVAIRAEATDAEAAWARDDRAAAAFSGGLDATFLVWRHHANRAGWRNRRLVFCVMIHGFDILLKDEAHFEASLSSAQETLADLDLPLKAIATNLRDICDVRWDHLHGTSLAACMQFFKGLAPTFLVASSECYSSLVLPWGSSPLSEHLLSSATLRLVHDGAEFNRSEKAAGVCDWKVGFDRLRVCWGNRVEGGNCCVCEKCLRTMANFLVQGLPVPESLGNASFRTLSRRVLGIRLKTPAQSAEWRELLGQAKGSPWAFWRLWVPCLLVLQRLRHQLYLRIGRRHRLGLE